MTSMINERAAISERPMLNERTARLGFWLATVPFSLLMLFTAYNELADPRVAQVFAHLGFPTHAFRVELSVAKVLGIAALLTPLPPRLKEWAYAGFTINLAAAFIAHVSAGDGPAQYAWALGFGVFLALSYIFHLRLDGARS